jgi:hypothetical protein
MKKVLKVGICLFLLIGLVTGCGCNKKKETTVEEPENPNAPIINYQTVNDLKFGAASFYVSDGKTYITTSVVNETKKEITVNEFNILFKDSNDNVLKTLNVKLGKISAGETREISESVEGELTNTSTIDYEIK